VKKPQWITLATALFLMAILYVFGRIVPEKKANTARQPEVVDNGVSLILFFLMQKKDWIHTDSSVDSSGKFCGKRKRQRTKAEDISPTSAFLG
jgi:hypothetical protein